MLTKQQTVSIVKHLRAVADILEGSTAVAAGSQSNEVKSKRGRKPGAVDAEHRCKGVSGTGDQCKNRATQGTYCGKHTTATD
jgi:hypothetical protein